MARDTPDGGGGGGGRIAIYFASDNFTGNILAFGGAGANYGGAGTIFTQASPAICAGQLRDRQWRHARHEHVILGCERHQSGHFRRRNRAGTVGFGFSVSNLFVGSNSSADLAPDSTPLALTVNGDATVESNAASLAATSNLRLVRVLAAPCLPVGPESGGGYGGYGGGQCIGDSRRRSRYGSIAQPSTLGSPGGGGSSARGGGAIKMTGRRDAFCLDGKVSANGASGTVELAAAAPAAACC